MASRTNVCPFCLGSGLCHRCEGTGIFHRTRTESRPCRECDGTGKCPLCGGKGSREDEKPKKDARFWEGGLKKRVGLRSSKKS